MSGFIDTIFWGVGVLVTGSLIFCVSFIVFAVAWCWATSAYGIWKGYVEVQERWPELEVISQAFRDQHGTCWKWVLLGALLAQYGRMMDQSGRVFETDYFSADLRGMKPVVTVWGPPTLLLNHFDNLAV